MKANELRKKYIDFFVSKGHAHISGASLIPENDPTVLFTTAGMHPLVPYIQGAEHPAGKRLTDFQKCIRTGDIDCVGDSSHLTFFEMLGNWSLGDYFKEEAIAYSFEFLTQVLGIDPNNLSVTVFEGDDEVPRDTKAAEIWESLGIQKSHIYFNPREDNWWGPAGETGPCGPDTEMFIDTGKEACGPDCKPGCHCGKYLEIWNDVMMQFSKDKDGKFTELSRKCIDTGMGLERTTCILQGKKSVYETELFVPIINKIEELANYSYTSDEAKDSSVRIIADHIKASTMILGDEKGLAPSNIGQGYILRRLIRRTIRHGRKLGMEGNFFGPIVDVVLAMYKDIYPELEAHKSFIMDNLNAEYEKFSKTLSNGEKEFTKICMGMQKGHQTQISGRIAFKLYDTYGFPIELTQELASENNMTVDLEGYKEAFAKHQEASRSLANFSGGLADHGDQTTALHTATHLLHEALCRVLGGYVKQLGSNITAERLRFDFNHDKPVTSDELKQIEDMVNEQIQKDLPVTCRVMSLDEAQKEGAFAQFTGKYGEQVKVYTIGDFSEEVCGGPHVEHTGLMGHFKITKEQSSSAGVRRIKAILE